MRVELNEKYDGIKCEENVKLYAVLVRKIKDSILRELPGMPADLIDNGKEKFVKLDIREQIACLLQIVLLCKTGRSGSCDLTAIGGSKQAGTVRMSANLSNWKKYYSDVRIVDSSAAGLYESKSRNLLELL